MESHRSKDTRSTADDSSAMTVALFTLTFFWGFSVSAQETFSRQLALDNPGSAGTMPLAEATLSPERKWNAGFGLGAGCGLRVLGTSEAHDLAGATFHIGKVLDSDRPGLSPFLHHMELGGELWTGAQYHPDKAFLVGLTPMLRYRFLLDARWTPFLDAGAGVTATDIGRPDLSTTFEFNLQAGAGLEWRWRQNTALMFQARYIHVSNARIETPDLGVNSLLFSVGLTWFF
jgi:hypothetical protein